MDIDKLVEKLLNDIDVIECGRQNGIYFIGFNWNYGDKEQIGCVAFNVNDDKNITDQWYDIMSNRVKNQIAKYVNEETERLDNES